MLVDVKQDAQTATGDVVQVCTVYHHIFVCTVKHRCKVTFSLRAGHIVKVAFKYSHQFPFLFVNRNIHILSFYLQSSLFLNG